MIILPGVPGFEVQICVNGAAFQEYSPPPDHAETSTAPNAVTRFIEATTGANFRIRFKRDPSYLSSLEASKMPIMEVFVDGRKSTSNVLSDHPLAMSKTLDIEGHVYFDYGTRYIQLFRSSELDTSGHSQTPPLLSKHGQIVIELSTATCSCVVQHSLNSGAERIAEPADALSDEGITHRTSQGSTAPIPSKCLDCILNSMSNRFDAPTRLGEKKSVNAYTPQPGYKPFAAFTFEYRSKSALESMGVISPPATVGQHNSQTVEKPRESQGGFIIPGLVHRPKPPAKEEQVDEETKDEEGDVDMK